ncbi:MAG: AAA family ATPase [Alphaproteobacteria bacterium]|nr:AAA family ATPase [Alphaproteobacteria bacterium]
MPVSKEDSVQLIAFLQRDEDVDTVNEALKGINVQNSEVNKGGIAEAIHVFMHKKSPRFLIVDISKSDLPLSDLAKLSEVCEPGISVLTIGLKNDVGLYRNLMKLGIFEYLVSPLFPDILIRTLKSMIFGEEKGKEAHTKFGKVIAVVGARGGVGTTFIATNFAAILASEKSRRAVIMDLDLYLGTVPLYFDLKPSYGLKEAFEDPERVDQVFIERLLTSINERLFMISTEESLDEPLKYQNLGVETILKYLSKLFHYIVIDVPHCCNEITQAALKNADIMILVAGSSISDLRDTARLIQLFEKEGMERRVIVVMNKFMGEGKIKLADFEENFKHKIDHIIPYDSLIPMESITYGQTLATENNPIAESIRSIVEDVQGVQKSIQKLSKLESFLKMIKLK